MCHSPLGYLILSAIFCPLIAGAEWVATPSIYLRSGTAVNSKGGLHQCFNNPGSNGNEFRLGNECGSYHELGLGLTNKDEPVPFAVKSRLAYGQPNLRQWEDSDSDGRDLNLVETYATANLNESIQIWVGKRFYRDVDAYLNDWYYYADSSGVGAGIAGLKVGPGQLALAHIFQGTAMSTEVGTPVLQMFDARWTEVPLAAGFTLNTWAGVAWAQATKTATTDLIARNGYLAAARLRQQLNAGFNDFTLAAGHGVLEGLNLYGDVSVPRGQEFKNDAERYRLVDNLFAHVADRLDLLGIAAFEWRRNGTAGQHAQWLTLGLRPVWLITDHFQWAFEAGWSQVHDNSEVSSPGVEVGTRNLCRLTTAPQWSFKAGAWGRPVMRAFASYSFWNEANRGRVAQGSGFEMSRDGANFGYQLEFWY